MTARSERPISRLISWVRPPMRPLTDSRSDRVLVEAGSIAYSAVTHPSPEPFRQRGTPSDADAAHSTRVPPNSTSTEPAAWSSHPRVSLIGRSSSSARPSARVMSETLVAGAGLLVRPVSEVVAPLLAGEVPAGGLARKVGGGLGVGVPAVRRPAERVRDQHRALPD